MLICAGSSRVTQGTRVNPGCCCSLFLVRGGGRCAVPEWDVVVIIEGFGPNHQLWRKVADRANALSDASLRWEFAPPADVRDNTVGVRATVEAETPESAIRGNRRFRIRKWSGARDLNPGPHGPEPHDSSSKHVGFRVFQFESSGRRAPSVQNCPNLQRDYYRK
jgi:hypothetical protein